MNNDVILALLFVGLPVLAFALWAIAARFSMAPAPATAWPPR